MRWYNFFEQKKISEINLDWVPDWTGPSLFCLYVSVDPVRGRGWGGRQQQSQRRRPPFRQVLEQEARVDNLWRGEPLRGLHCSHSPYPRPPIRVGFPLRSHGGQPTLSAHGEGHQIQAGDPLQEEQLRHCRQDCQEPALQWGGTQGYFQVRASEDDTGMCYLSLFILSLKILSFIKL